MRHFEGTFQGAGRLNLYYQSWHPSTSPKAAIAIVHGLGSHSGRFTKVVESLLPYGYAIYGFDLRGHGRSPGQRGFVKHWSEFREDFGNFWELVRSQNPDIDCFALCHSLGSIIVLDYALHYPNSVPHIITMASPLQPVGVPQLRMFIGRFLSWMYPRFSLNTGMPQNRENYDPAIAAQLINDSLSHTKGTARLVTEFLKTTRWINAHLENLQSSILALHGSNDAIALPESSLTLFDAIPIFDKEYREYPNSYHDLHNDKDAQKVLNDIFDWLERHLNGETSLCKLDPTNFEQYA